jgi:hypothetical protein
MNKKTALGGLFFVSNTFDGMRKEGGLVYNSMVWQMLAALICEEAMAQNVIQLPQEMYEAVRRRAVAERKTADRLVTEWVAAHLDEESSEEDESLAAFEKEIAAFEVLKPTLLEQYAGQYVAIHQGKVVASGDNKLEVSRQAREQYGLVNYYVDLVALDSPRRVRIPSFWVTRE